MNPAIFDDPGKLIGQVFPTGYTVAAVKPKSDTLVILGRKGTNNQHVNNEQWVTAIVTPHSLENNEWFWGHYYQDERPAREDFDKR